jgi:hypothetical protein
MVPPQLSKNFFLHQPPFSPWCMCKENLYEFLILFKALQHTSQKLQGTAHQVRTSALIPSCCIVTAVKIMIFLLLFSKSASRYVLWFHIHLIALHTVIRATGLLFLQYICSFRQSHFCLVIFLFFYFANFPYVGTLFIMNEKTEYSNMTLDVLPACHTFQTRFHHEES